VEPSRRQVTWTPLARTLLDEALEYVAERSLEGALDLLDEVERVAGSLATMSERGRLLRRFAPSDVREVFVRSYRLVYRVSREAVEIIAFVHTRRDYEGPAHDR